MNQRTVNIPYPKAGINIYIKLYLTYIHGKVFWAVFYSSTVLQNQILEPNAQKLQVFSLVLKIYKHILKYVMILFDFLDAF